MFRVFGKGPLGQRGERIAIENPADGGIGYWLLKLYGFGFVVAALTLTAAAASAYVFYSDGLPPLPSAASYADEAPAVTRIYAGDGTLLAELANEWREVVPLKDIPLRVQRAFIATEDHRFYQHGGIDLKGVARAFFTNLASGELRQGGSTITQQVAKVYLGSEKTFARKIREAIVARRIEARTPKSRSSAST